MFIPSSAAEKPSNLQPYMARGDRRNGDPIGNSHFDMMLMK